MRKIEGFKQCGTQIVPLSCIVLLLQMAFTFVGEAQTNYQRIHSFGPTPVSGRSPRGNLVQGTDGFLYGITYSGGSNEWGSVFKVAPNGAGFKVLHHFVSPMVLPVVGLVEASNGSLYGTVPSGGSHNAGVIFKIQKDGSEFNVLHHFNPATSEGGSPQGALIEASDNYLYGTAAEGGSNNLGVVFRISPTGADYTALHHFTGVDGKSPSAALIEGHDGVLYGTARKGAIADSGTVFKLLKDGTGFNVLHQFFGSAQADGQEPIAEMHQASDGFLYGTTYFGGNANAGTIFKVNTNGTGYSVIYNCQQAENNGAQPVSGLIQGVDGLLYGTMPRGGIGHNGVAFRIGADGAGFSIIHSFTGSNGDGAQPSSTLLLGNDGALYGSAFSGGDYVTNNATGIIFKLGLLPFPGNVVVLSSSPTLVELRFEGGVAGKLYNIERSLNLTPGSWQSIGSGTAKIDGSFEFSDLDPASNMAFYRVVTN